MTTLLKLGGSLITDKKVPHTARKDVIRRLGEEIRAAWDASGEPLIIGHGSGSFGHVPAKQYGTRHGVHTEDEWKGFAEVHAEATALNRIITDSLREAGLPVLSFVPMDSIRTSNGEITFWDTAILQECLSHHIIPLIFGDTVFDKVLGGTILSTEDLFTYLCGVFSEPPRILLAGLETGVWKDYPKNTELVHKISAGSSDNDSFIQESEFTDVTGGMHEKVRLMKSLIIKNKAASAIIFSGEESGNVRKALEGRQTGTVICP